MIVMMMASTPSLNASSRLVLTAPPPFCLRHWLTACCQLYAASTCSANTYPAAVDHAPAGQVEMVDPNRADDPLPNADMNPVCAIYRNAVALSQPPWNADAIGVCDGVGLGRRDGFHSTARRTLPSWSRSCWRGHPTPS
jgi:hypothetical protein